MWFFKKRDYYVKIRGNYGVEYREGDKKLLIDSEFLEGDPEMIIYFSMLKNWDGPHADDILSAEDLERIKANVLKDLNEHKINAEVG